MRASAASAGGVLVEMFRSFSDCDGDVESRFTKDELLANVRPDGARHFRTPGSGCWSHQPSACLHRW